MRDSFAGESAVTFTNRNGLVWPWLALSKRCHTFTIIYDFLNQRGLSSALCRGGRMAVLAHCRACLDAPFPFWPDGMGVALFDALAETTDEAEGI